MDFTDLPVEDINPEAKPQELTATTPVVIINRGFDTLVRKYDGFDWPLRPHTEGLIRVPYGAAVHFQKHGTVPGSRDPVTGTEASFIGIIRNATTGAAIDPAEFCEPFTPEQCAAFGLHIEAIAREEGEVHSVPVSQMTAAGRIPVGRQSAGSRRKLQRDGHGNVAEAMAPPDGPNDAQTEIAAAAAEADRD